MYLTKKQFIQNLIIIAFLFFNLSTKAQDLSKDEKLWTGFSVSYKINKKFNANLSQLFAFQQAPNYSFSQTKISLRYKLKKRTYASIGYARGLFNKSNSLINQGAKNGWFNTLSVEYLYSNLSFKHSIVKRLSLKHRLEYHYFFPDIDKYKTRFRYVARLVYNIRKSTISPYIENQVFYYSGGIISNGIKRNRFKTGFRFKFDKKSALAFSLYYMVQNEFKTDILRDNDYKAYGIQLSYKIN